MAEASDDRIHMRVYTVVPCVAQSRMQVHGCHLLDLSRGGAQLESELDLGSTGDALSLAIGLPEDDRSLQAKAEIMRKESGEFSFRYGIRFSALDPETRQRLFAFIETMGGHSPLRYGRRIEVALTCKEQLKAVMRDVSQGGVGLISSAAVVIDEPVNIDVRIPNMRPLTLPGRVSYVHSQSDGTFAVGVSFTELKAETKRALEGYFASLC